MLAFLGCVALLLSLALSPWSLQGEKQRRGLLWAASALCLLLALRWFAAEAGWGQGALQLAITACFAGSALALLAPAFPRFSPWLLRLGPALLVAGEILH